MPRLSRHALDLRLRTRKEWLSKAGVTPEAFQKAVQTMLAAMDAVDSDGAIDWPVRTKAAIAFAELVRHTVGLTAEPQTLDKPSQIAVVFNTPDWLTPKLESHAESEQGPPTPQKLAADNSRPTYSAAEILSGLSQSNQDILLPGRCHARTSKRQGGQPCELPAQEGETYCKLHQRLGVARPIGQPIEIAEIVQRETENAS